MEIQFRGSPAVRTVRLSNGVEQLTKQVQMSTRTLLMNVLPGAAPISIPPAGVTIDYDIVVVD